MRSAIHMYDVGEIPLDRMAAGPFGSPVHIVQYSG